MKNHRPSRFHRWIRNHFAEGFWFPFLVDTVDFAYNRLSPSERFIRSFNLAGNRSPAAPELWQFLVLAVSGTWLTFIYRPSGTLLTSTWARGTGTLFAAVLIADLLLFVLHWLFVDRKALHSTRRSLATFGVSLIEISILFAIIYTLTGCAKVHGTWTILYENFRSILRLRLAPVSENLWCQVASHSQLFLGGLVYGVAVTSLIGAVVRPGMGETSR